MRDRKRQGREKGRRRGGLKDEGLDGDGDLTGRDEREGERGEERQKSKSSSPLSWFTLKT